MADTNGDATEGNFVYLDTETTGFYSPPDEMLEIAIVDDSGDVLLDSLIKPERNNDWPDAMAVNGITPEMVSCAPPLFSLAPEITRAVEGRDVVIYNAAFDSAFLGDLLSSARSVICCMKEWAEHEGEWSERHKSYRRKKLSHAASAVHFEWPGNKHRALADAMACRAVWQYLKYPAERARVDAIKRDILQTRVTLNLLQSEAKNQ